MAYDFKRNYTQTFTNGVSDELVTSHVRTLHGFFGPKFQTGSGPFCVFVTGKVGFDNFSITNDNATTGFRNVVGLSSGTTRFAVYPEQASRHLLGQLAFVRRLVTTSTSGMAPITT